MKKIYLFFIIMVSFSCTKEKSTRELIVGDKGYKFWISVNKESEESIVFLEYLDKNGKWLSFKIEDGQFGENETPDDVIRTEKWHLENDSTLILGESSVYNLSKITQDYMILYSNFYKMNFVFIAAPESLIPKTYQKMQ